MITIVKARQTSMACPSQWDLWDGNGQYYYARFRHDYGILVRFRDEHWVGSDYASWPPPPEDILATFEHEAWDITLEDFAQHAGIALSTDLERVAYWRHITNRLAAEFKDDPAALARADQLLGGIDLDQENIASTTDTVDEAP